MSSTGEIARQNGNIAVKVCVMVNEIDKTDLLILKSIQQSGCVGATKISVSLALAQLDVPPRTVRFRLSRLDKAGFTILRGRRQGRELTEEGRRMLATRPELTEMCIPAKSRANDMVYRLLQEGQEAFVVLDFGLIPPIHLSRSLVEVHAALSAGLGIVNRLAFVDAGKSTEWLTAPGNVAVLGTVSHATWDGLLMRHGVNTSSMGTGVMDIRERRPVRFTEWIGADSCCVDAAALFIAAEITRVRDVIRTGSGKIIAEFREIPAVACAQVTRLAADLRKRGWVYVVAIGRPGESLCGLSVGRDRCGVIVTSGTNTLAAVRETGIDINVHTYAAVHPRDRLSMVETIRSQMWQRAHRSGSP